MGGKELLDLIGKTFSEGEERLMAHADPTGGTLVFILYT
jgi:hypothetical protein